MAVPVSRKGIIPVNNKQTNKTTSDSFSQQAEREVTANILSVLSSSLSFRSVQVFFSLVIRFVCFPLVIRLEIVFFFLCNCSLSFS